MENTKDSDKEKGGNKKKFELSFKSIHEQAKEKVEEKLIADQKKKDQGNDNGLDEKVLNVLSKHNQFKIYSKCLTRHLMKMIFTISNTSEPKD